MPLTTDPNDERLGHGFDQEETEQEEAYLVLSDEEIEKGFVRPVRTAYKHKKCGKVTRMNKKIAETYARDPDFYCSTYCCHCRKHLPVSEFVWVGTNQAVGS